MPITNFEFKAKVDDTAPYEKILLQYNPRFAGVDHQKDTYFNTDTGRLKLREGNIENALIHYKRADLATAKISEILLYEHKPSAELKAILVKTLGVKVIIDKQRKIYFLDHIKFHFDEVKGLGTFLEVEAIDIKGAIPIDQLQSDCDRWIKTFALSEKHMVKESYSDLLLTTNE